MIAIPKINKTRRTVCDYGDCYRTAECVEIESSWTSGGKTYTVRMDYCWSCFKKLLKAQPVMEQYSADVDRHISRQREESQRVEQQANAAADAAAARITGSAQAMVGLFSKYEDYACRKINLIKAVREATGAGLNPAKDAVENAALNKWPPQPARFTSEGGIANGSGG